MSVQLSVISSGKRLGIPPLGEGEPPLVPAQNLIVEIEGEGLHSELLMNDEWVPLVRTDHNTRGHALVDCYRSTGFHRIMLGDQIFCFGTADAKLELDGVIAILDLIGEQGLSWGHQLIFSDGKAIRDPHIDYAWLRKSGRTILNACQAIADCPATNPVKQPHASLPKGGRIKTGRTLALLRSNPREFLEEHEAGLIRADGRRWMPRRIVTLAKQTSEDTPGNRRATRLLLDADDLSISLLSDASSDLPKRHRQWLQALHGKFVSLLDETPFKNLERKSTRLQESPAREELEDPRYQTVFETHRELTFERAWQPGRQLSDHYAYVGYSDEIYQAFVAVLLGKAFEAERIGAYLRRNLETPAFQSEQWSIYYDTEPPKPGYSSWRDSSSRPAQLTPDYCIVNRGTRHGILGDAKYRGNKNGQRLPSSALGDCQIYMQHFGCSTFVVFYPGPDFFLDEIKGGGCSILEVSVTPVVGITEWMRDVVRPRIEALVLPLEN